MSLMLASHRPSILLSKKYKQSQARSEEDEVIMLETADTVNTLVSVSAIKQENKPKKGKETIR